MGAVRSLNRRESCSSLSPGCLCRGEKGKAESLDPEAHDKMVVARERMVVICDNNPSENNAFAPLVIPICFCFSSFSPSPQ